MPRLIAHENRRAVGLIFEKGEINLLLAKKVMKFTSCKIRWSQINLIFFLKCQYFHGILAELSKFE